MQQMPENRIQRILQARNDAPAGSKAVGLLGFGTIGVLGKFLVDTNPLIPHSFMTGHTADVFGTTAMMYLMSNIVSEKSKMWNMAAVMFGVLSAGEMLQGLTHSNGFDMFDFAAYAGGIALWAGTDRLAKRRG